MKEAYTQFSGIYILTLRKSKVNRSGIFFRTDRERVTCGGATFSKYSVATSFVTLWANLQSIHASMTQISCGRNGDYRCTSDHQALFLSLSPFCQDYSRRRFDSYVHNAFFFFPLYRFCVCTRFSSTMPYMFMFFLSKLKTQLFSLFVLLLCFPNHLPFLFFFLVTLSRCVHIPGLPR